MPLCRLRRRIAATSLLILTAAAAPSAVAMRNGDANARPIDVVQSSTAAEPAPSIAIAYAPQVTVDLVNTGPRAPGVSRDWGSLKVQVPEGSHVEINGQRFRLLQFHFNLPDAQAFDPRPADVVVHFVHVRDGAGVCDPDALLVLGARVREGEAHAELGKIASLADRMTTAGTAPLTIRDFRLDAVLPAIQSGWRYPGAATTPSACRTEDPARTLREQVAADVFPESVAWIVLQEPIRMSSRQIAQVRDRLERNLLATKRPNDAPLSHSGE